MQVLQAGILPRGLLYPHKSGNNILDAFLSKMEKGKGKAGAGGIFGKILKMSRQEADRDAYMNGEKEVRSDDLEQTVGNIRAMMQYSRQLGERILDAKVEFTI